VQRTPEHPRPRPGGSEAPGAYVAVSSSSNLQSFAGSKR
jgi:hypothetical protein